MKRKEDSSGLKSLGMAKRLSLSLFMPVFLSSFVGAQTAPATASAAPIVGVTASLPQLDQTARRTVSDLQHLRVEKWKADANTKLQARDNVDSLEKNLSAALPVLTQAAQANPTSVAAGVKLYRNLNVVYDVLASVSEATGAFGSKDDYQALATDTANIDNLRRNIADELEQMASAQDASYAQFLNRLRAQQAATAAAPPTKVIVDDTEPARKSAKKKKTTTVSTTPQ